MKKCKKTFGQDIRQECLFRAFSDITYNFSDWYQATQLEIGEMEQELANRLLPNRL